ncbi:hypothetical protein SprV_0802629800 [Sparganum proliferum]
MIRLFYLFVLIHVSHGCFKWNIFGSGENANDTAITTESYANSTSPSNVTSNPPTSGPMNETSIKPEAGDGPEKQQDGLKSIGHNMSVNNNSRDGDDSNDGTVGNGSSTAAPPTTIKPEGRSNDMPIMKLSAGKATSSSIRSQLGLELFGLSLVVVCCLF